MRYKRILAVLLAALLVMTGCRAGDDTGTAAGEAQGLTGDASASADIGTEDRETGAGTSSEEDTRYLLPSERAEYVEPAASDSTEDDEQELPAVAIPYGTQSYTYGRGDEGVSILCSDTAYLTKNNLQGIVIQLADEDMVPGVWVRWVNGETNAAAYLENKYIPALRSELDEQYKTSETPCAYMIEGKELYGTTFYYTSESGKTVVSRIYAEECEKGLIVYRSEGYLNRTEVADRELEFVIKYAKSGTTAYANTYCAEIPALETSITLLPSDAAKARLTRYENKEVSFDVPEGWTVTVWGDGLEYTVYAFDPARPDRQIFFNLKTEGIVKSQAAHRWYSDNYGDSYVSTLAPVLTEPTTEGFFKIWNDYRYYVMQRQGEAEVLSRMIDFRVVEEFGKVNTVGDLVRGEYESVNGIMVEGLFTATPLVKEEEFRACDEDYAEDGSVDVGFYNIFSTVFIAAPADEYLEWADTLLQCIASISYDQNFLDKNSLKMHVVFDRLMDEQDGISRNIRTAFAEAWKTRDTSYDISSRKKADKLANVIRIYDTRTGYVYRAAPDFLDEDEAGRYAPATEEMYLVPISGYVTR